MYDIEKLRTALIDNYGCAMNSGFGLAVMDIDFIENANDIEILELAKKEGLIK